MTKTTARVIAYVILYVCEATVLLMCICSAPKFQEPLTPTTWKVNQ